MFVVMRGRVRVVEASGRELATFEAGGYFGEMSMLTGQPRSASVLAADDCEVLELTAASLRAVALANPDVLTRISAVVAARRADLERQKAEFAADQADAEEVAAVAPRANPGVPAASVAARRLIRRLPLPEPFHSTPPT